MCVDSSGPTAKHGWKTRYFTLAGQYLRYFKKEGDTADKELGCVQLSKVVNLWVQGGENVPPKPALEKLLFSMDVMQPSGIPREFVMCAMTEESKLYWVAALQEAIETHRTGKGKEIGAPVMVEKGIHLDSKADLEHIMTTLTAATGMNHRAQISSPQPPGPQAPGSPRTRAATGSNAVRPTGPPSVIPELSPNTQRRNTATTLVSPRRVPVTPPMGESAPLSPVSSRPPPPAVRAPLPGVAPKSIVSQQPPPPTVRPVKPEPAVNRPEPVSRPAPAPRPAAQARPSAPVRAQTVAPQLPVLPVATKTVKAAVIEDEPPDSFAPAPPPVKSKTHVAVVTPAPVVSAAFDDTSSGYDTEEVVEPFRQQGYSEERLAAFDFEPQDEEQIELVAGDKIIVEVVEGEWIKGLNVRTSALGWCPTAFCTSPL